MSFFQNQISEYKRNTINSGDGKYTWNQLVQNGNFATTSNWIPLIGTIQAINNECVYTVESLITGYYDNRIYQRVNIQHGHKYFVTASYFLPKPSYCRLRLGDLIIFSDFFAANVWNEKSFVIEAQTGGSNTLSVATSARQSEGFAVGDICKFKKVMLIDLTQLFGEGNEPTTVEEFEAWAKAHGHDLAEYQPYDAGTVMGGNIEFDGGVKCVLPRATFYGACEQNGTPTPDNPVPIKSNNSVWFAYGKNLFDKNTNNKFGGYFPGGDSTIIDGRLSDRGIVYIPCKKNTTYTLSRDVLSTNERFCVATTREKPHAGVNTYGGIYKDGNIPTPKVSITIITDSQAEYLVCWAYWSGGTQALDSLQIELGSTMTDYEPYIGGTVDISTLNLCGISGVCDEWDSQTGDGIRRIGKIDSYNGEEVGSAWISSTGELSTGATVYYVLAETVPFHVNPQQIIEPRKHATLTQISGDISNTEAEIDYITHS